MKVVLDLDELLKKDIITQKQADYFLEISIKQTGSTAINLLVAFGAIAISIGTFALTINFYVGLLLGVLAVAAGFYISKNHQAQWGLLGSILTLIGALFLSAALMLLFDPSPSLFLIIAILYFILGIAAPSKLLIALSPFAIAASLGSSTFYEHAMYGLIIQEPTKTIFIFSLLAWAVFMAGKYISAFENSCNIFSRVCVILVNFGFWVGSLWGDTLNKTAETYTQAPQIPPYIFAIIWAIGLIALGAWAVREDRRFIFNTVAVFASIHFYTQWFEYLGMQPLSVLFAGCLMIAIALALWKYNKKLITDRGTSTRKRAK